MHILIKILLIFVLIFAASTSLYAKNPERIISLKPNITELIFALGAGDKLVGVTTWCDRPEAAKKIPKVSDYIKPNIEKIIALKPDLVISSEENSVRAPIEFLRSNGTNILLLSFKTIDDIIESVNKLSEATGTVENGKILAGKIASLRNTGAENSGKKVLITVGKRPLVAASEHTYIGQIAKMAGLNNVIKSMVSYPHVNIETVLRKDPDIIFDLSMGSESDGESNNLFWKDYDIRAARQNRLYTLNISDFRPDSTLPEQVKKLMELADK